MTETMQHSCHLNVCFSSSHSGQAWLGCAYRQFWAFSRAALFIRYVRKSTRAMTPCPFSQRDKDATFVSPLVNDIVSSQQTRIMSTTFVSSIHPRTVLNTQEFRELFTQLNGSKSSKKDSITKNCFLLSNLFQGNLNMLMKQSELHYVIILSLWVLMDACGQDGRDSLFFLRRIISSIGKGNIVG